MERYSQHHGIIHSPVSLRALLHPPSRDLERDQRFSWFNCLLSVFSYLLMVSDVPRTGLGVRDLAPNSPTEPDQFIVFGPFAYPVAAQLAKNESTVVSVPFWPYKYDSTSVSMRAVAKHFAIPEWPACLTYDAKCDERDGIPPTTVFNMIDSLIQRTKTHNDTQGRPGRLTLRTHYDWCDRLHSFAFPSFFLNIKPRTIRATHYDLGSLQAAQSRNSLCGSTSRAYRPLTCGESWTNFGRLCTSDKPMCRDIGRVHSHIPAHLHQLRVKYPNDTVDFVLLEGVDDVSRSSLTLQGYKNIDVVALARVRKCSYPTTNSTSNVTHCETILVDDFRYEVVSLVTNVRDWFSTTALLRSTGQFYAWMRLVFLLVGCYAARSSEPRMQQRSRVAQSMLAVRTMFLLPSQVMVYGSLFPITCYLVAHLIDSAAVYEIMRLQFSTVMGVISLDVIEILRVCAVSMRSLWLLALMCHVVHRVATQCVWSPIHGVPGVPELSLSFVASLTILAQVKYPSLRDSRVLSVEEVVSSPTHHHCNSMQSDSRYSFLNRLLFGTPVDYKCLALAVCVHVGVVLLFRLVSRVVPRHTRYEPMLFTRTVVPFSAGSLWPVSALVVSWNGTFLAKPPSKDTNKTVPAPPLVLNPVIREGVAPVSSSQSVRILVATKEQFTASFHHHITRCHDNETLVFLMNLGVMTDPLTFIRLRMATGPRIGLYTHSRPYSRGDTTIATSSGGAGGRGSSIVQLPLALATSSADIPIDWNDMHLVLVVHTSELAWCDLLQCG